MSYDLTFLHKPADVSWDDLRDAEEDADLSDEAPDAAQWAAITAAATQLLGEVELHAGEAFFELDHNPTGLQLTLYAGSAAITVPYWHQGPDAQRVVRTMYDLAAIVERHTGLTGYDPQLERPTAEASPEHAVTIFDQTAAILRRRPQP
ncbi:hypothetical protein [Dactylosporangium sp. CS-033363]|uniref:hypothetical protein n=1 Tax=Dactylosporangium sp. CS-033363 TaxID=3239935 RepID=UPI003D89B399